MSHRTAPDTVRYALTGAAGDYGRTLLAQRAPGIQPRVLCDIDTAAVRGLLTELQVPAARIVDADTPEAIANAAQDPDAIIIVPSIDLLPHASYDILVEATGRPEAGFDAAAHAVQGERHVTLVSKEIDSFAGVHLAHLAASQGTVVTPALGDQPANLIEWTDRLRAYGLDIIAIGKSSEYDLVFDPETETVTQLDETIAVPGFGDLQHLGDDLTATLAARAEAVAALKRTATADSCEMAVVSNYTGFTSAAPEMLYPVVRPSELADVYALREHGGILPEPGHLDVFSALRLPGETSFAGGVFAIVRTGDPRTWEILRGKGHVVSRDGRTACLFLPYHLMGVETPVTLTEAVRHGRAVTPHLPTQVSVLAGRTTRAFSAGESFVMGGHHHDVEGVAPVVLAIDDAPTDIAPLYLAGMSSLDADLPAGTLITLDRLTGCPTALLDAWQQSRRAGSRTH